jgi:excisionase family DNA binding protein
MSHMPEARVPLYVRLGESESRQLASAAAASGKTKRQLVEEAVREHLLDDGLVVGRITLPGDPLARRPPPPTPQTSPSEVMTLAEAAAFLRLDEPRLSGAAHAGELPAVRIGGEWRFSRRALLDWLAGSLSASQSASGSPSASQPPPEAARR